MSTRLVSTHEAKSRLSELIRAAQDGEAVVITRNGQPVAKLVPWPAERPSRAFGLWSGDTYYDADLAGPDDDVAALFDDCLDAAP
jgi:prevent-host-death family protein